MNERRRLRISFVRSHCPVVISGKRVVQEFYLLIALSDAELDLLHHILDAPVADPALSLLVQLKTIDAVPVAATRGYHHCHGFFPIRARRRDVALRVTQKLPCREGKGIEISDERPRRIGNDPFILPVHDSLNTFEVSARGQPFDELKDRKLTFTGNDGINVRSRIFQAAVLHRNRIGATRADKALIGRVASSGQQRSFLPSSIRRWLSRSR